MPSASLCCSHSLLSLNILLVGDKARILPDLKKHDYEIAELNADGDPVPPIKLNA